MPVLKPEPIMCLKEINWSQVYFKMEEWKFEKEYRTQKFWRKPIIEESERKILLPKEAFNCVILGKYMDESDKKEIIDLIKDKIGDIEIKEQNDIC